MKIGLKQGFSLVEIALALLVIGIGVITVVGLFGSSLDAGKTSRQEMQLANFADMVFGTLDAMDWYDIPSDYNDYSTNLSVYSAPPYCTWHSNIVVTISNECRNGFSLNITNATHGAILPSLTLQSLRYEYVCEQSSPSLLKKATLHVWAGELGTFDPKYGELFYREFYNWGAWK